MVSHFAAGGLAGASKTITFSLGIALLLTAVALVFRQRLQLWARSHHVATLPSYKHSRLTMLTGATLGILVSLSSVGADLAHRIPERVLRLALAGMLVLVGAKLIAV